MFSSRPHITVTMLCLAIILLFAWHIQNTLYVNWDAGYLLHATELFLNGGTYTNDFFTPNTPMIFYLYMPPVIAKTILNVGIITSFQLYIFIVCTISLVICFHLLQRIINPEDKKVNEESAAWQRKEGKNPEGGLNAKGIASYRRENPGSKLSLAVTTPPSKLKKGSKAANRRKSFCARMGGMPGPMKDEKGRPTRKALALRKWNC